MRSFSRVKYSWKNLLCIDFNKNHNLSYQEIFENRLPVLFKGFCNNWPAISDENRRWNNFEYMKTKFGNNLIPLEIGGNYMNKDTQFAHTTFEQFLDFISKYNSKEYIHLYLAQYDLSEMPELLEDICTPEMVISTGKKTLYNRNLWFSTKLSNSPCHYDPFQNILCQVIGRKRIVLLHPNQKEKLYPALGTVQYNTSTVNFQNVDLNAFPLFAEADGYEVCLDPGDAVYIPYKWWHYCESETTSCSVNFWWL